MAKAMGTTENPAQTPAPTVLTTGELSEVLGIRHHQLVYLIETKQIPPPRKTLLGRRLFYLQEDLAAIQERLRTKIARKV